MIESVRLYLIKVMFQHSIMELRKYPELDIRIAQNGFNNKISFQGDFSHICNWTWKPRILRKPISDQRVITTVSGLTGFVSALFLYL